MNLREISEQYLSAIDEETGELNMDQMELAEGDFQAKAEAMLSIATDLKSDIEKIDAEIKRLNARKSALKNNDQRLRDYLRDNMQATGITKITCPLFTVTLRNPSVAVVVDNMDALPDDYVSVKTTIAPNKNDIKKAIKEGVEIPGARLEESKPSLLIK